MEIIKQIKEWERDTAGDTPFNKGQKAAYCAVLELLESARGQLRVCFEDSGMVEDCCAAIGAADWYGAEEKERMRNWLKSKLNTDMPETCPTKEVVTLVSLGNPDIIITAPRDSIRELTGHCWLVDSSQPLCITMSLWQRKDWATD